MTSRVAGPLPLPRPGAARFPAARFPAASFPAASFPAASFPAARRSGLLGAALLGAVLGLGSLEVACKPPPPTTASVKAGDLPAAGDWSGVFYSPLYGHLHLVHQGNVVSGKWRTTNGDKWGELHGEVTGDLLKYKWVEHRIGMIGPGSTTEGHGYFKYSVPADENANHEIKGEWGLEASEIGNPWQAVRQRNMLPDPNSVQPDETERVNMPDEWDSAAKAKPGKDGADSAGSGEGSDDAKGDKHQ